MPRGYGRGFGMSRGYWGRYSRGRCVWPANSQLTADVVSGEMTYVGPCRCGFGPHAYYRTNEGRLVHASALLTEPLVQDTAQETVEQLRKEKEQLEKRIRILETDLAKKKAGTPAKKKI
jgi:hypothetical protein